MSSFFGSSGGAGPLDCPRGSKADPENTSHTTLQHGIASYICFGFSHRLTSSYVDFSVLQSGTNRHFYSLWKLRMRKNTKPNKRLSIPTAGERTTGEWRGVSCCSDCRHGSGRTILSHLEAAELNCPSIKHSRLRKCKMSISHSHLYSSSHRSAHGGHQGNSGLRQTQRMVPEEFHNRTQSPTQQ